MSNTTGRKKEYFMLVLLAPVIIFVFSFFQTETLSSSVARGKEVYEGNCMSCHMSEGEGLEGAFPPLAGTGRLKDKARLVKVVLNGTSEVITVEGTEYSSEMAGLPLNDQEVMDVLNYIRNTWGNKAPIVTLSDVKHSKK